MIKVLKEENEKCPKKFKNKLKISFKSFKIKLTEKLNFEMDF
jgi:hypothetical protein